MVKITDLSIIGFGRFQNSRYKLGPGINLIYGGNEAGKSTLHRFIEAMLFGFWQPGVSRKEWESLWLRYQPWQEQSFAGELSYSWSGGEVLVRRDFAAGTVEVVDKLTGAPLEGIPLNSWGEADFARQHMGCSKLVFRNTISISQLGSVTDVETADEIRELLRNLAQSGGSGVSVQQALLRLEAERNNLGTEQTSGKHLASARDHWQQLSEQLDQNRRLHLEARQLEMEHMEITGRLEELEANRQQLRQQAEQWRSGIATQKMAQIQDLQDQQSQIEAELAELAHVELSPEVYEQHKLLVQNLEQARDSFRNQLQVVDETKQRLNAILDKAESLKEYSQFSQDTLIELASTYQLQVKGRQVVAEQEQQMEKLSLQIRETTAAISQLPYFRPDTLEQASAMEAQAQGIFIHGSQQGIEGELRREERKIGSIKVMRILALLAVPALGAVAWFLNIYLIALAALPALVAFIIFGSQSKKAVSRCRTLRREIYALEMEFHNSQRQREQAQQELAVLFEKAGVESMDKLKSHVEEFNRLGENNRELHREFRFISTKLESYRSEIAEKDSQLKATLGQVGLDKLNLDDALKIFRANIDALSEMRTLLDETQKREAAEQEKAGELEAQVNKLEQELTDYYKSYSVTNESELVQLNAGSRKRQDLEQRLALLRQRCQDLLGADSTQVLAQQASAASSDLGGPAPETSAEFQQVELELERLQPRRGEISGRLEAIYRSLQSLAELEESVDQARTQFRTLQTRRQALDIAIETIDTMSQELGAAKSPGLHTKVSELIQQITGGKYREISIGEGMDINVRPPGHNEQVSLEKLSGGTIDQFYFACRIAIADLMTGNTALPLFLDDSFVQYDDQRLTNMVTLLKEMAKQRQVLLFTCQKRELELLSDLAPEQFNLINLDAMGE